MRIINFQLTVMFTGVTMKPRSAKNKGRRLVTKIIDTFLETFKELKTDDFTRVTTSQGGEDIPMSPVARLLIPYSIESKNVEKLNIYQAYEQAHKNADKYTPIVISSKNRFPEPLVTLSLTDFLTLLVSRNKYREFFEDSKK